LDKSETEEITEEETLELKKLEEDIQKIQRVVESQKKVVDLCEHQVEELEIEEQNYKSQLSSLNSLGDLSKSMRRDSSQINGEDINGTIEALDIKKNLDFGSEDSNGISKGENIEGQEVELDETDFFVSLVFNDCF
jgi:predicted RNase H-like nuclease (RuvC/YqgF family)